MSEMRLLCALGEVDDEFIEEAAFDNACIEPEKRVIPFKALAAAAAIAVFVGIAAVLAVVNYKAIGVDTPAVTSESTPAVTDITAPPVTSVTDNNDISDDKREFEFYDVETQGDNPASGIPISYDEVMDSVYAEKLNLVRFEILERYSSEDAAKLNESFDPPFEDMYSTLYRARIEYDYLNDKAAEKEIYLIQDGTPEVMLEEKPLYGVGEKYVTMFYDLRYDRWNKANPDFTFKFEEGISGNILYQLDRWPVILYGEDGLSIGEDIPYSEQLCYTTTSNVPMRLVRKYDESLLAEFIRGDWKSRGYAFPSLDDSVFDTSALSPKSPDIEAPDNDALPVADTDTDEDINSGPDTLMIPDCKNIGIYDGYFEFEDYIDSFMPIYEDRMEAAETVINGETVLQAPPMQPDETYERLMSDESENARISSLCKITVTRVLSGEEAAALAGYDASLGDGNCTFYEGAVTYDYMNKTETRETVIFPMRGTLERPCYGQPPYAVGDKIALVLKTRESGSDITRPFRSYALAYDVIEFRGSDYFAVRGQSTDRIEEGLKSYPHSISYSSTQTDNSVRYFGFYSADAIADRLNELWSFLER